MVNCPRAGAKEEHGWEYRSKEDGSSLRPEKEGTCREKRQTCLVDTNEVKQLDGQKGMRNIEYDDAICA